MKKFLLIGLLLIVLVATLEPASAWTRHGSGHGYRHGSAHGYGHGYRHGYGYYPRGYSNFGVFIGPPAIFVPPPLPPLRYYYYDSYPPDRYYDYYEQGDRVWVPGYYEYRRTPYGWQRVWIPGHWEWR